MTSHAPADEQRADEILADLRHLLADALELDPGAIDVDAHFAEIGADSILLLDTQRMLESRYGVRVTMRQVFTECENLRGLSRHLAAHSPPDARPTPEAPAARPLAASGPPADAPPRGELEAVFAQQLQALERLVGSQLAALGVGSADTGASALDDSQPIAVESGAVPAASEEPATLNPAAPAVSAGSTPRPPLRQAPAHAASDEERARRAAYLRRFTERYTARTKSSKELAQSYRRVSADIRAARNFRFPTKELVYPIAARRSRGARIWDLDENEYVDLTMGFGTLLFGHGAPFITEAIQEQIAKGLHIGPQSERAGPVAKLISSLTGMERVSFAVSGSEAVMTALRVARAQTGRSTVVLFADSYHGQYDGTLIAAADDAGTGLGVPLVRGITPSVAADTRVLEYGNPRSLDVIRSLSSELAAVLVEPIQSRHPALRPVEFLKRLRDVTRDADVPLIFDEVLTGFRLHPGGAAAWLGVQPDLSSYGKVLAGGLPIGAVAGDAKYLDLLDGGYWEFGDDSFPSTEMTFAGGTFVKHPLSMAVAHAVLTRLEREGPAFQERLSARTAALARRINDLFERGRVPLRLEHCGSLFRFVSHRPLDLFFYKLIEEGVYVWEQRICFLSEAHTDEDLDHVAGAVERSVTELQEAGVLPGPPHREAAAAARTPAGGPHIERRFELTDTQKQILFLSMLDRSSSGAYHEAALLRIAGAFDYAPFVAAAQRVVDRHQALRLAVAQDGVHQEIHASAKLEVPLTDLADSAEPTRHERIRELLETDAERPFDLERPPLIRARVVRLSPDEHLLFLAFHALAVDGMSMGVIIEDLARFYAAERDGRTLALSEPLQLEDYVRWARARREGEGFERAERYWVQKLEGKDGSCPLPLDRARPSEQSYAGGREHVALEPVVRTRLNELAARERTTFFTAVFAAFCAFLHRVTGEPELLVGVRVASRSLEGSDSLVALTTNLLPITSVASGDVRFSRLLAELQGVCFEAIEHQVYPFTQLVARLKPKRDPGRHPLCNVIINLDRHLDLASFDSLGTRAELCEFPLATGRVDLEVQLTEVRGELRIDFEYSADLFEPSTVQRWIGQFARVLEAVAADPEQTLADLPLLSADERARLLVEWNDTERPYPYRRSLLEGFDAQAARDPHSQAISARGEALTYRELQACAQQLARELAELGVGPEVPVGLYLSRSPRMAVAMLGVLRAGAAFVPLDLDWPEERLAYVVEDVGLRVILTGDGPRPPVGDVVCLELSPERMGAWSSSSALLRAVEPAPESLAYAIYTSGSTGSPKAALLQRDGMANHLFAKIDDLTLGPDSVVAQTASQCFDIAVWQLLAALLAGGRVHVIDDPTVRDPRALLAELDRAGVTVFETVPSLMRALVDELRECEEEGLLASLRWLLATGEALPPELARQWLSLRPGVPLLNAYGPTECSDDVTHHVVREPPPADELRVPIGRPIGNLRTYVLDAAMSPVPVGTPGELFVAGVGVGRGYLNDERRTSGAFVPAPAALGPGASRLYRSGDRVRLRHDGGIEFLGRSDEQVKLRGFRVELGEIEAALLAHPAVRAAAAAIADPAGQRQLVAYYEADELASAPDAAELRELLQRWLPDFMLPSVFVRLDALPLTVNGKIDRRALPDPALEEGRESSAEGAPADETERALAGIWAEVLHLERVGVHENYFELGGDSILSIQIVNRAREQGLDFRPNDLFRHQTVAELAASCARGTGDRRPHSLERAELEVAAAVVDDALQSTRSDDPERPPDAGVHEPARPFDAAPQASAAEASADPSDSALAEIDEAELATLAALLERADAAEDERAVE